MRHFVEINGDHQVAVPTKTTKWVVPFGLSTTGATLAVEWDGTKVPSEEQSPPARATEAPLPLPPTEGDGKQLV